MRDLVERALLELALGGGLNNRRAVAALAAAVEERAWRQAARVAERFMVSASEERRLVYEMRPDALLLDLAAALRERGSS